MEVDGVKEVKYVVTERKKYIYPMASLLSLLPTQALSLNLQMALKKRKSEREIPGLFFLKIFLIPATSSP